MYLYKDEIGEQMKWKLVCVRGVHLQNFLSSEISFQVLQHQKVLNTFPFCAHTSVSFPVLFLVMTSEVVLIQLHGFY